MYGMDFLQHLSLQHCLATCAVRGLLVVVVVLKTHICQQQCAQSKRMIESFDLTTMSPDLSGMKNVHLYKRCCCATK